MEKEVYYDRYNMQHLQPFEGVRHVQAMEIGREIGGKGDKVKKVQGQHD